MKTEPDADKNKTDCTEIRPLLVDYMNRELGPGRTVLVREHLRKCRDCQVEAAEMQATMDVLQSASKSETDIPNHLSDKHRARINRSITHPILDWIYVHHVLFSVVLMVAILLLTLLIGYKIRLIKPDRDRSGTVYEVKHYPSSASTQEVWKMEPASTNKDLQQ